MHPSRRRLLQALFGVSGVTVISQTLPRSWTQPVIRSVVLPAHAQTSPNDDEDNGGMTQIDPPSLQL